MKLFTKAILVIVIVGALLGLGFLIDGRFFYHGEEELQAPAVGIKGAIVDPTFVTSDAQPVVRVFVKGEAARVWVEIARRIEPTKGGETLSTLDLQRAGAVAANLLNTDETGEIAVWTAQAVVPETTGQYLLTAKAADADKRETKFKMFNSILTVQEPGNKLMGKTPGQSTALRFYDFLSARKYDDAYSLLTLDVQAQLSRDQMETEYRDWHEVVVTDFQTEAFDPVRQSESELISLTYQSVDGQEQTAKLEMEFVPNRTEPLEKWQISSLPTIN